MKEERQEILEMLERFSLEYIGGPALDSADPGVLSRAQGQVVGYVDYLSGFGPGLGLKALQHILYTRVDRFFPKMPDLVAAMRWVLENESGAPSKEVAWEEVKSEIIAKGARRTPEFSHAVIADAVQRGGGWLHFCQSDHEGAAFASFGRGYEAALSTYIEQRLNRAST